MKLLKSIYDESFDIANEFFSNKKEGFEDDNDDDIEGFEEEDEGIEGMKSKKKKGGKKKGGKSKKKRGKKSGKSRKRKSGKRNRETNFDFIGWAVKKANGTNNDEQMVKNILNSLFVTFLSFLIAHNWYYTFFINPTNFRLENSLSFLKENEFIHFFTMYIVQIVKTIDEFIMTTVPEKFNFIMANTFFGKRSIFYFILSVSLASVPYFLKQIQSIFFYFEKQGARFIDIFRSPGGLRNFIHDIISKGFKSVFLFKGNPALSALIGIIFVMKYMENLVIDHSKGIIENATEVIPSFFTKIMSGSIFYIIYLVFKFAIFYQPTIAFSSFIITVYMFYFSIVRLPKLNGLGGAFAAVSANIANMNDGKVVFKHDLVSKFKNNIEEVLKFIVDNAHQIILLFTLKANFKYLFNIDSKFFKTTLALGGFAGAAKLLFSIVQKYGIGDKETQELGSEIANLTAEITSTIEAPDEQSGYQSMFDKIYKPYKSV